MHLDDAEELPWALNIMKSLSLKRRNVKTSNLPKFQLIYRYKNHEIGIFQDNLIAKVNISINDRY